MGSYKQGYKSPNMGYKYSYPTPPFITTHEPPSRGLNPEAQNSPKALRGMEP